MDLLSQEVSLNFLKMTSRFEFEFTATEEVHI